jgi:hypothetical protein
LTLLDAQLERNIQAGPYGPLPPPVVDANLDIPPIWGHRFNTITSPYGLVFVGLDHNHQQSLVFSFRANCRLLDAVSVVSTLRAQPWWSRPCGLGLGGLGLGGLGPGGLDLAVSASAVVSTCAVSAPVVSTLRSRPPRWSRPVRSRPPRLRLDLCSLDLSIGVI